MIKAIIFDFFGVLEQGGQANRLLLDFIRAELKPKYKVAIISNSTGRWRETVLTPQDVELFDEIVVSEEVNLYKPEPEIYIHTAQKLGAEPKDCLYIDDYDFRVEGAEKAGMQAIVYKNFEQTKAELGKLLTNTDH